jgi:hypothetical protein
MGILVSLLLPGMLALQAQAPSSDPVKDLPRSLQDEEAPKSKPVPVPESKEGVSFYPMPALNADKDAGLTYGILGALLFTDKDGVQSSLISLAIAYQHLVKWSGEVEYRYSPTPFSTLDIDGYYAQHVENSLRLYYEDTKFLDAYHARFESFDFRSTTDRFFGVGDNTPHHGESVRTSNEYRVDARFGPRIGDSWDIEGTIRFRKFRASDSLITDLPQTTAAYPTTPGVEGGSVVAGGVRIVHDTRENPTTPESGVFMNAFFERAEDFAPSNDYPYWLSGISVVSLWPNDAEKQFVTAVDVATQLAVGNYIPFWELPALGGPNTLRSYNAGRFTNKGMVYLSLEERIRVYTTSLFGVGGEVQVAPFFDLGKVYDSSDDLFGRGIWDNFHYSGGIGFRGVVKPSFVGRLDIAMGGREGVGVTVGLDYPY